MAIFGAKNDKASVVPAPTTQQAGGNSSPPRAGGAGQAEPLRVGIDHAITLLRSLPTAQNVDLVVTVLKTTLESLNIRVVDIVNDASRRLHDIENRVATLKGEIKTLEGEVEARVNEIRRLEAAHEETTRVKDYLHGAGKKDAPAPHPPAGSEQA
jgi:hypothetical protein